MIERPDIRTQVEDAAKRAPSVARMEELLMALAAYNQGPKTAAAYDKLHNVLHARAA